MIADLAARRAIANAIWSTPNNFSHNDSRSPMRVVISEFQATAAQYRLSLGRIFYDGFQY